MSAAAAQLPRIIAPDFDGVPPELRDRPRWILWRFEHRNGNWTKTPFTTDGERRWKDEESWSDFETAVAAYRKGGFAGIGFVLGDGIAGVDLDDPLLDGRKPKPWAKQLCDALSTYTELSPSGRGVHALVFGTKPQGRCADHSRGVEIYDHGRFLTVTGRRIKSYPANLQERTEQLAAIHAQFLAPSANGAMHSAADDRETALAALAVLNTNRCDGYESWLQVGMALHSVDASAAMLAAWNEWSRASAKYCSGACESKWQSFDGNGVGIGSLILWAKEDRPGWAPPQRRTKRQSAAVAGNHNDVAVFLTNASPDSEGELTIPKPMQQILADVDRMANGFPKRVGSAVFVPADGGITWLESTEALFGWLCSQTSGPPQFRNQSGFHTKAEVFAELRRTADAFAAVESLPHEPPMQEHFYTGELPQAGSGECLRWVLDRFCPSSDIDRSLIQSAMMTLLWGGPPGTRPAFVVTADAGRGSGKSKFVSLLSEVVGGHIELSANEDASVIRQRLLSPEGLAKRLALLDNVKSLRFSWAELESLITSSVISGKRMYVGEAQRPNTLTWFITLNGVSLSTDLAQRAVVIKLSKPTFDPLWEEQTRSYIREHRRELLGDLIAALRANRTTLAKFSRWNAWERDVLSRLPNPSDAQVIIAERQQTVDVEGEEANIVEDAFLWKLRELQYDPDVDRIFIPSVVIAGWFSEATKDRQTTIAVSRKLKQLIDEGAMKCLSVSAGRTHGRGFIWTGPNCESDVTTRADIEQRISRMTAKSGDRF